MLLVSAKSLSFGGGCTRCEVHHYFTSMYGYEYDTKYNTKEEFNVDSKAE